MEEIKKEGRIFRSISYSVIGGVVTGSLALVIQRETLRFGFLSIESQLKLMLIYTIFSFSLFLIVSLHNFKDRRKVTGLYLSIVFIMIGLTQLNCNPLPNVLMIVSDATRADHLSLYGYNRKTTPFLEKFAKEAVVFNQAMSQGTHTIVSAPSLLASVYPSTHKLVNYRKVLNPEFVLISEMLKSADYATFGCAANPHLGIKNGFSQGFDTYIFPMYWENVDAPKVFHSLIEWLSQTHAQPFFGFLFCIDPHTPYDPPPPYDKLFDPQWQGKPVTGGIHGKYISERQLQNMIARYDGEIALVDKAIENFCI